jgi:hypothetical protein
MNDLIRIKLNLNKFKSFVSFINRVLYTIILINSSHPSSGGSI